MRFSPENPDFSKDSANENSSSQNIVMFDSNHNSNNYLFENDSGLRVFNIAQTFDPT